MQHIGHIFGIKSIVCLIISSYYTSYNPFTVYPFTRIHPVKIGVPFRAEIKFITQSIIIHLLAFRFVHDRGRPTGFENIQKITIPVQGINQRQFGTFQIPVHLLGRPVQTVQYLKLYLLIRIIVVCHIQTGHEVTHVLYHVTIFVNINRIQIKFYTTIRGTLLSGKK